MRISLLALLLAGLVLPGCSSTGHRRPTMQSENPTTIALPSAPDGFDQPRPNSPRGTLTTVDYHSTTTGEQRRLTVYTPPGFNAHAKRLYPVVCLLHGRGDDETGWSTKGHAEHILDNLLADGLITPMIVVMPNGHVGTGGPDWNAKVPPPQGPTFQDELLKDVLPLVESRYPIARSREGRAVAGLSMGGAQSMNIGLARPDLFSHLGTFSTGPTLRPPAELLADTAQLTTLKYVWISCGDNDNLLPVSKHLHGAMGERAIPHTWHLTLKAAHDWPVWRNDLYWFTQRLFR